MSSLICLFTYYVFFMGRPFSRAERDTHFHYPLPSIISKAQKEVENGLRELPRHVVHTYCMQSKGLCLEDVHTPVINGPTSMSKQSTSRSFGMCGICDEVRCQPGFVGVNTSKEE